MKNLSIVCFILLWTACESGLRIIGGRDALQHEFPYVVRLELKINILPQDTVLNYFQLCTGAALTSKWVLSAAHCIEDIDDFTILNKLFLRYNSYFPDHVGLLAPFLGTIVHPGYNLENPKYDILLIRSADINVSQYGKVNAVDIKSLVGHEALSLGFGRTNASSFKKPLQVLRGMLSNYLQDDGVFYIHKLVHMICLVRQCTVKGTICGGDSGGPVMHPYGIVGVHSMAVNDCYKNTEVIDLAPGTSAAVISPISPVQDWIRNTCK